MAANTQSLATRLARGEESAFAELYDACADRLHAFLLSRLGDSDSTADVLQTAFVQAVQNRKHFAKLENPQAYMFTIARNEAIQAMQQSRRRKSLPTVGEELQTAITADAHCEQEELANVALAKLNPEGREIVELKIYALLTFQEIAKVTGQPLGTVTTRYRRALESLRPWLKRQLR
jgi:RNA polymerase sigma-70 factor, ECF subfamily